MKELQNECSLVDKRVKQKTVFLLQMVLIAVLLLSSNAFAANLTCHDYCEVIKTRYYNDCKNSMQSCQNQTEEFSQWCHSICSKDEHSKFSIQCIHNIALGYAKKLWGNNARIYDVQRHLGPDNKIMSHVFVFAMNDKPPTRNDLLNSSKYDLKETHWDNKFKGIEIGANSSMPPILSYWDGVPAEYYFYKEARHELKIKYGIQTYVLSESYLTGIFQILSFKANGKTYYFDIKSKKTTDKIKLSYDDNVLRSRKYRNRIEDIKKQWVNHLSNVKEVCDGI